LNELLPQVQVEKTLLVWQEMVFVHVRILP
jgi:hypothetical protein